MSGHGSAPAQIRSRSITRIDGIATGRVRPWFANGCGEGGRDLAADGFLRRAETTTTAPERAGLRCPEPITSRESGPGPPVESSTVQALYMPACCSKALEQADILLLVVHD